MESMAASRYPDTIEILDTVVSMDYKIREAVGQSGATYQVFVDNSVRVIA